MAHPIAITSHIFPHPPRAFEYETTGNHIVQKCAVVAHQQQGALVFQ